MNKSKLLLMLGLVWLLAACAKTATQPAPQASLRKNFDLTVLRTRAQAFDPTRPWVLVDTKTKTLKIMRGNVPVETFSNIALGSSGVGIKRFRGDSKTPVGVFRIGWLNEESRFNLFFGLDYPNLEYAEKAYRENRIDELTYYTIRRALEEGRTPPQDTLLGGSIGIHGLGAGDPQVHANVNWTEGCIALDNQQIKRLAQWIGVGTRVEIR